MKPRRTTAPKLDVVLVTWVSVNHGAAPLVTAINDPKSPLRGRVRRVHLCWRDAAGPDGADERAAVKRTLRELHEQLDPVCPELVEEVWKTRAAPIDHEAIRPFAEDVLRRVRGEHPNQEIAIHLSPGTPAVHAVWLVLGSTGFVPGQVTLLQTVGDRWRAAGRSPVMPVRLNLDTWLRRYRSARPRRAEDADHGHLWDPTLVKSPALKAALERLAEWAPLRTPVLLHGERGTGKTTLANYLRAMSPFQKRPGDDWPVVVCGQFRVNPELARSELFGHAKGAFTGANHDRAGLLEEADGDTLFLDEVGDIDKNTQRLLVAAVEGRGFQRVGESKVRRSRFRLVCATNRPLAELRRDCLDPDFFDRIGVFVLEVPPLRDCREDLPHAWRQVLESATASSGVRPDAWEGLVEDATLSKALLAHDLPGNFRDLQRAALHSLSALNAGRGKDEAVKAAVSALGAGTPHADVPISETLPLAHGLRAHVQAFERRVLTAALEATSGNKAEAARLVRVPRKTFDYRLRLAGILG